MNISGRICVWTKAPAEPGDFKTKVLACIISQPKGDCLRMQLFFRGVHGIYGLFSFAFAFLRGEWVYPLVKTELICHLWVQIFVKFLKYKHCDTAEN